MWSKTGKKLKIRNLLNSGFFIQGWANYFVQLQQSDLSSSTGLDLHVDFHYPYAHLQKL